MKLEIAAGDRPTPGYVHQDARPLPHIDPAMVFDAAEASKHVGAESCTELRATHILEHFSYLRTVDVLRDWLACLRPGGLCYIEVPNLTAQARLILGGGQDEYAVSLIFGGQDYPGNTHFAGFTAGLLLGRLEEAGFVRVTIQDIGLVLIARAYRPG